MTEPRKRPSWPVAVLVVVGIAGVITGVVVERGFTLTVIPVIVGGVIIWAILWFGGFQLGGAFADWLERRWR